MKRILLLILIVFSTSNIFGQIYVDNQGNVYDQRQKQSSKQKQRGVTSVENQGKFDLSRLEFGGNVGLQFGTYTSVNIAPQIGYRFSKLFSAGAGIGYSYYKDDGRNYDYREHFLSFNLYANLYPVDFLIFSVRPEISRAWISHESFDTKFSDSKFVPSLVVGGGFRFGPVTAQVKYDVVQDKYSPYGDRLFYSIGYTFSL